jgi:hypothetical protein
MFGRRAMIRFAAMTACALLMGGCTSSISQKLGTLKNPYPILSDQTKNMKSDPLLADQFSVLKKAAGHTGAVSRDDMRKYLDAGFTLSKMYCEAFFRDADESQRRRQFGRSTTNDVGTALSAVLGLASAGEGVVTGVATGFGLADGVWRNYDDAFLVSPDLSNVQALVESAMINDEQRTQASDFTMPENYHQAQRLIIRHANHCSTLGMRSLLNGSASNQKKAIDQNTEEVKSSGIVSAGVLP